MITVIPIIADIKEFQRGEKPQNALRMDAPRTIDELQKKATPIAAVLCAVLFVAVFSKTITSSTRVVNPLATAGGVIIGFVLLAVHEWLHALLYPKDAIVTIGKVKGKPFFVALVSYPLRRSRFIIMCLLPFVLGVLPLSIFVISPAENLVLNGLMFGLASVGMVSPYPDVYNVILILKQAKKKDWIMFYEDDLFRIPG